MADIDPNVLAELNDNIALMNETMRSMTGTLGSFNSSIKDITSETKKKSKAFKDTTDATGKLKKGLDDNSDAALKNAKIVAEQSAAFEKLKTATKSLATAILDNERSFAKYNTVLGSAGEAASQFGKSLGPLGAILGGIVKAGTFVAQQFTKQADNLLKASDDISKLGAANSFTAEQIRQLGKGAGLASDNLDKMIKPMQSMSGGLTLLGATSADGVKKFGEMIAVTKETRMAFQRLGLSDGELIQAQADYVGMLERTGGTLVGQQKTQAALQKQSLEYTQNLYELSAITGKSIEESKKDMEINRASLQFKLQENKWAREYQEAERTGNKQKMESITREREAANRLINDVSKLGDPAKTAAVQMQYLTGAITKESAQFAVLGVNLEEQIKNAKEGNYQSGEFNNAYKEGAQRMVDAAGGAIALSEGFQKASGLNEKALTYLNKRVDVEDEVSAAAQARAKIDENAAGKGAAAMDPAQQARNALTEAERAAKLALDDMIASVNPLLKGYEDLDNKMKLFMAAVIAATVALGGLAISAGLKSIGKIGDAGKATARPRDAKGRFVKAGTSTLGSAAKTGARALGKVAAPLAIGMGVYDAYQGFTSDKDATLGQKFKNAGSSALSGATFGLLGSSPEEIAARKATPKQTKEDITKEQTTLKRQRYDLEQQANDEKLSEAERKLAAKKLRQIDLENARLEHKLAKIEFENAKDPEEKAAAIAKSDRLRTEIQQLKRLDALDKLENSKSDIERKAAKESIVKAETELANIKIWRATQELKSAATEDEKKAAQAKIDAARAGLEQSKKDIDELAKSYDKPSEVTTPATTQVLPAPNLTEPTPSSSGPPRVEGAQYAGEFAKGGLIPKGKFGLVGERGPELITGPSNVIPMDKIQDSLGKDKFEKIEKIFTETDESLNKFTKEISKFTDENALERNTKQLKQVTDMMSSLQESLIPLEEIAEAPAIDPSNIGSVISDVTKKAFAAVQSASGFAMPNIAGMPPMLNSGGSSSSPPSVASAPFSTSKRRTGRVASASSIDVSSTSSTEGDNISRTSSARGTELPKARPAGTGSMSEEEIKKMIIQHEGIRNRPYKDSLGLWTVGVGHLIGDGRTLPDAWNREFSQEEIMALFEKDYEHHRKAAEKIPGFDKFNSMGQGALTDLTFNMGPAWIKGWPNTRKRIEEGDAAGAAQGLSNSKWATQVGNRADTIIGMIEQGSKISAAKGGLVSGPESGFLATLHGNEIIVPLDPNSILADLGTKTKEQIASESAAQSSVTNNMMSDNFKDVINLNQHLMTMLSEKLDNMIGKLETSNSTQDKLLKYTQS